MALLLSLPLMVDSLRRRCRRRYCQRRRRRCRHQCHDQQQQLQLHTGEARHNTRTLCPPGKAGQCLALLLSTLRPLLTMLPLLREVRPRRRSALTDSNSSRFNFNLDLRNRNLNVNINFKVKLMWKACPWRACARCAATSCARV